MQDAGVVAWGLTSMVTIMGVLVGAIWKILRDESKEQKASIKSNTESLSNKASMALLAEAEKRWEAELKGVKENSERLFTKIEARHDKELEDMARSFEEQIRRTEANILTQLRLMMETVAARDRSNHAK